MPRKSKNKRVRFFSMSLGGLLGFLFLGVLFSVCLQWDAQQIRDLDLIHAWMGYRLVVYCLLLAMWQPLCHWLTRPHYSRRRFSLLSHHEPQQTSQISQNPKHNPQKINSQKKRQQDIAYLKTQWWKVALLFAFFEWVVIQQFGF